MTSEMRAYLAPLVHKPVPPPAVAQLLFLPTQQSKLS
jgi:hypothetical protein